MGLDGGGVAGGLKYLETAPGLVDTSTASTEIRGTRWEMKKRERRGCDEAFEREAVRLGESEDDADRRSGTTALEPRPATL